MKGTCAGSHEFGVSWRAVSVHRCFDYRFPAAAVGAASLLYQAAGVSEVQRMSLGGACLPPVHLSPHATEAGGWNSHRVIAIRP